LAAAAALFFDAASIKSADSAGGMASAVLRVVIGHGDREAEYEVLHGNVLGDESMALGVALAKRSGK
jgi:hypothetical protein